MTPPAPSQQALDALRAMIRTRAGIVFGEGREKDLAAGARRAMARAGLADIERYTSQVNASPELFDALMAELTVSETYFFREPSQFDALSKRIIPDLLRKRAGSRLRMWSAACSTGEEPYSLAILLEEMGLSASSTILGTDISRPILSRARQAKYSTWSFRGDRRDLAASYFDKKADSFVLREDIRRRVTFQYLNLASSDYPSAAAGTADFDLIFCRNVLIYFDRQTVAHVAERLFQSLREGGWLLLGPSDPPIWDFVPLEVITTDAGVLYCKGKQTAPREISAPMATRSPFEELSTVPRPAATTKEEARPSPRVETSPTQPAELSDDTYTTQIAQIRLSTNRGDAHGADRLIAEALEAYPISAELHYLHGVVMMQLAQFERAAAALRRVIYLDASLVMAHFALGTALRYLGDHREARRTYQRALGLCNDRPMDEVLPLSDNEPIRTVLAATRTQLSLLEPEKV
jgi:chemotaxis protein methyltransferase CheR